MTLEALMIAVLLLQVVWGFLLALILIRQDTLNREVGELKARFSSMASRLGWAD